MGMNIDAYEDEEEAEDKSATATSSDAIQPARLLLEAQREHEPWGHCCVAKERPLLV